MDKGARVRITGGKGGGVCGTIFWKGANKWGPGERYGVRGDNGETYWVGQSDVESTTEAEPEQPSGPTFSKGDRVRFKNRGIEGTGTVFWIGQSRNGPGQRLGVNDDHGEEAVWLDAFRCEPLTDEPDAQDAAAPEPPRTPSGGPSDPPFAESLSMDEMPAPPPIDDDALDGWANAEDDYEDDEPPLDWEQG